MVDLHANLRAFCILCGRDGVLCTLLNSAQIRRGRAGFDSRTPRCESMSLWIKRPLKNQSAVTCALHLDKTGVWVTFWMFLS